MKALIGIAAIVMAVFGPGLAGATLVRWTTASGGNDHWYDYIVTDPGVLDAAGNLASGSSGSIYDWNWAKTDAQGRGGYLATLTSQAENDFVWTALNAQHDIRLFKLGGYQTSKTVEPGGNWAWVTGEAWADIGRWYPGDPNNGGSASGNQDWLAFSSVSNGTWFDIEFLRTNSLGYIIEYNTAPVPEPGTLLLLGSGLLGLAGFGKRFAKR